MKNDFVFFWGGPFSNFYPAKINVDGEEYLTTEQYFMSSKALFFGDLEINKLIMEAKSPKKAKNLGRKIKDFDADEWSKVCKSFMFKGNYAKYTQHKYLQEELLATGDKKFVEASPFDHLWGIGLSEENAINMNPEDWPGKNWLGEILNKVRYRIIKENIKNNG